MMRWSNGVSMHRVTIKEAASLLGVDEEVVRQQVKSGQLVACQDTHYQGYVWLKDTVDEPPARKSAKKAPAAKGRSKAPPSDVEDQVSIEAEKTAEPETSQKSKSKSDAGERRPRTSQRAQEVQLLREVVDMLKAELSAKNQQLELKDAEIEARREEIKELLAILNQTHAALPAPPERLALPAYHALGLRSVLSLALENILNRLKLTWQNFRSFISRLRSRQAADDEIGTAGKQHEGALSHQPSPVGDDAP